MEVLAILMDEHKLIQRCLDHLTVAVVEMEEGKRPPVEFFRKAFEFARRFSDKYHHFKEEYLLFSLLASKKNGQIDSLRYQHERGRNLINEMDDSLDGYFQGREIQTMTILENLAAYISLLRQHINREDRLFFLMAGKEISEKEGKELLEEFKKEERRTNENILAHSRRILEEMEALLP
ncbi:MAG: hypothetical protein FJ117_11435 [Deltaproteobacteria bacterium]|nr:hypothetical protein [Deltaproteobacteria bacterium]